VITAVGIVQPLIYRSLPAANIDLMMKPLPNATEMDSLPGELRRIKPKDHAMAIEREAIRREKTTQESGVETKKLRLVWTSAIHLSPVGK